MSNINSISELIAQIEHNVSSAYFFAQLLTIICLFLYGLIFLALLSDDSKKDGLVLKTVLAYPIGLAAFSVIAFLIVTLNIPYNSCSVIIGCILALLIITFVKIRVSGKKSVYDSLHDFSEKILTKYGLILFGMVILAAVISCLGILSITVSNDSMYRATFYPRAIVHFGGIRSNFGTFLTDLGQGYALINTLPFLFGFNEAFGLQHMLNLSFLALLFETLTEFFSGKNKRFAYVISTVICLILLCSMPFMLISKWILSNAYFMVFLFVAIHFSLKKNVPILSIVVAALSIMRIEGGIYAVLLILCISTLEFTNRELGLYLLCPVMILHGLYSARVFLTMELTDPYCFLTPGKAVIMIGIMILAFIYLWLIRGKLPSVISKHVSLLIMLGEILINLMLFIIKPSAFLENLKVFFENVMFGGGWGVIPVSVFSIYLICLLCDFKSFKWNYWDLIAFSFLLYAIAVTFMREGGLHVSVGDSGNRVLMQCVPFVLIAAVSHLPAVINQKIAHENE